MPSLPSCNLRLLSPQNNKMKGRADARHEMASGKLVAAA